MFKACKKRLVIILTLVCVMVPLLVFPASAAVSSVPVSSGNLEISYDGDSKTASYYFPVENFSPYWSVSVDGGSRVSLTGSTYQMSTSASSSTYSLIGYFAGYTYIDVSDLVKPSMYRIQYTPSINWIISGPPTSSVAWNATYQLWLYYYDSGGNSLGQGYYSSTITFNSATSGTSKLETGVYLELPDGCTYVRPTIQISSSTPAYCTVNLSLVGFTLSFDSNMVAENSETLKQIEEKLDSMQEQEKQEANGQGQSGIDDISGAIPDYSEDLKSAISNLASSMTYQGTEAKLNIPEISVPGIDGLYDGFTMLEPQTIDFEVYIDMMPDELLTLVQAIFQIALILYCVKELYDLISYILTLKGASGDE